MYEAFGAFIPPGSSSRHSLVHLGVPLTDRQIASLLPRHQSNQHYSLERGIKYAQARPPPNHLQYAPSTLSLSDTHRLLVACCCCLCVLCCPSTIQVRGHLTKMRCSTLSESTTLTTYHRDDNCNRGRSYTSFKALIHHDTAASRVRVPLSLSLTLSPSLLALASLSLSPPTHTLASLSRLGCALACLPVCVQLHHSLPVTHLVHIGSV